MKNGEGFCLLYSVTAKSSFVDTQNIREQLLRCRRDHANTPLILVANKIDKPAESRIVSTEEGKALADKFGVPYVESSAKDYNLTKNIFTRILAEYCRLNGPITRTKKSQSNRSVRPCVLQ